VLRGISIVRRQRSTQWSQANIEILDERIASAIDNWAVANWIQACRRPLIWPSGFLLREGFERMRLSSIKLELEQPPRQPRLQAAELVGCWLKLGRPGCAIFSNAQRSRGLPRPSGTVNEEETARDWHF
jgi:hypothetical protein